MCSVLQGTLTNFAWTEKNRFEDEVYVYTDEVNNPIGKKKFTYSGLLVDFGKHIRTISDTTVDFDHAMQITG